MDLLLAGLIDSGELGFASILLRLVLATVCGGVIGMERGKRRRPAGLRTHILVCIGAALSMMIGQYIYLEIDSGQDISRLGAQVISGIGFLGVGTIIVTGRYHVRGLTTAAGLWASACMGLAIGIGFYRAAIIACAFIWFVMMVLHKLDERIQQRARVMSVFVELRDTRYLATLLSCLKTADIKASDLEISNRDNGEAIVMLTLELPKKDAHADTLSAIGAMDGVIAAQEI